MRALVQRVSWARVRVDDEVVGEIGRGLCVLVGVRAGDDLAVSSALADKLWRLRILAPAGGGRMDLSLADGGGAGVLVVSQFTLYGDTSRGRRPSWSAAAPREQAEPLVAAVVERLAELGAATATGRFGAHMHVELDNDGPVTVLVEVDAAG
ncbi:MAG: D-aminoacyl-tRNA deacylase [Actinomycetota bacterium]|nr:D-aminoacyl-tRNA deacylase [Actinomycetota bacterium]